MAILLLFVLGIANFAMDRAVLESGHPALAQLPPVLRVLGGRVSLAVEFVMLAGAMLMVDSGAIVWAWGYLAYSALNAVAAWLILGNRF